MQCKVDLSSVETKLKDALGDVGMWSEREYQEKFSHYFKGVMDMYSSIGSDGSKLSDDQLEWVLSDVPIQMMLVSEELSKYKLNDECLKLYMKNEERDAAENSDAKTASARKEEAAASIIDYKILHSAYASVISRVESEITFSRELIMSCKKIWDSRRRTYEANPISTVDTELKDYTPKTYIG